MSPNSKNIDQATIFLIPNPVFCCVFVKMDIDDNFDPIQYWRHKLGVKVDEDLPASFALDAAVPQPALPPPIFKID